MKKSIQLYEELGPFLKAVDSSFEVELSGGVYVRFANSGRRGDTKWFNFGLSEILATLNDIRKNLSKFIRARNYEEKAWRDLGAEYFSDDAAKSIVTVQTKPVFTLLGKLIHWATGGDPASYSDSSIDLSPEALDRTVSVIRNMVSDLAPEAIANQPVAEPKNEPVRAEPRKQLPFREEFEVAIKAAEFIQTQ